MKGLPCKRQLFCARIYKIAALKSVFHLVFVSGGVDEGRRLRRVKHWMNSNEQAISDAYMPFSLDKSNEEMNYVVVQGHFSQPGWISSNEKKNDHVCTAFSMDFVQ
jgi:hypothetical protein